MSFLAYNERVLSLFLQGCVDTSPSGNSICRACLRVPWFHLTNLYTLGYGVPVCVIMSPFLGSSYGSTVAVGFDVEESSRLWCNSDGVNCEKRN